MAAAAISPVHNLNNASLPITAHHLDLSKDDEKHDFPQHNGLSQVHTPPTTDEGSHKDDDAVSTSSLSDLGDVDIDMNMDMDMDMDEDNNRRRFEDAARAGAEAEQFSEVKPARYENGVPIFQPNMEEFKDFQKYMTGVNAYGMQSGIVLIDPPEEWKRQRKALDDLIKTIKIKNPITQEFHGAQGIYTQRNMEKMRSYNLPQWKSICEQTENQPPAKRGEKRMNADKLLGRGVPKVKREGGTPTPAPETGKRRGRPPKVKRSTTTEPDSSILAPPTPTSPESRPIAIKAEEAEEEEVPEQTPSKGKRGRKPGPKPKGRQPKSTSKKETGPKSTETTVASRRLRNAHEAAGEIDEEAFKDFDYRVYDNDQWTAERCDELEEKYWKSLNFSNPMYAADMPGSLFDEDTKHWNVAKLPNLLDLLGAPIPGVNTAYLYLGMWRATFAWHLEDVDLYSINYIHFGAPKQWYSISQKDAPKFEAAMKSIWSSDAKDCDQFLRHKTYLVSPSILKSKYGVNVNKVVHREGQFVITFPIGYHSGYNLGYNCAESVNFALENWLQYGKTARKCQCEADSVFIDVDWFIRRMNGEPSPEYEEVEITDDEDDLDDVVDLPTPPGSDHGRNKGPQKRKRAPKDLGPNKKARKIVKIRKISKNQPCCLCPNDFMWEELLPTTNGLRAHRVCAMYTPETYIATEDGKEKVFNIENISKARLELRCHECKQKKGSCFQCSSAKCTRAYHATCAMHAGVQVDKGEVSVWHEGVEYRDIGFDWRCRLHRTVKRTRITSELSTLNHAISWVGNKEFMQHLSQLQPGEVIQWQAVNGDDIQAGVVVSAFDEGQNSILVSLLPDQRALREIDPAWILFVDSSTSCLQRPTVNALDLPEELQGKTGSLPGSTEKKPSEGDPFTEDPKTEWAEFVVEQPPDNKWQMKVDLSKEKQIFYYLGKTSTDSKAQYTADPARPVHDPASQFMGTVESTRMAPPPQPKRQSLAATYPLANVVVRNNAIASMRQQMAQQSSNPIPLVHVKTESVMNAAREKALEMERTGQATKPSKYRDFMAAAEAHANEQARIMQRQQAKVLQQQADSQKGLDTGNASGSGTGMGIQRSVGERQNSFQQQTSMTPRYSSGSQTHMSSLDMTPQFQPLPQYHDTLPKYYPVDSHMGYGSAIDGLRPQVFQYSNHWMVPESLSHVSAFNPIHNPAMPTMESNSPQLTFKATASAHNSNAVHSYNSAHFVQPQRDSFQSLGNMSAPFAKKEPSSIEASRFAATLIRPPSTPTEMERNRRISNPSYPFKSPEQIVAQKEEREKNGSQSSGSRPVSRPGSGYSTAAFPSPGLSALSHVNDPHPPMFINPTVTQISPPSSSHGPRIKSASVSAGTGNMGPPMPHFRRSMSSSNMAAMNIDLGRYANMDPSTLNMLPQPLHNITLPRLPLDPDSILTLSKPSPPPPAIAPPSELLSESLEPRPVYADGTPKNDKMMPFVLSRWQEQGGFWGRVSGYLGQKHERAATIYKSPFGHGPFTTLMGAPGICSDEALAGRFYAGLDSTKKHQIDDYRARHPRSFRP